jgi:hypothetical protein
MFIGICFILEVKLSNSFLTGCEKFKSPLTAAEAAYDRCMKFVWFGLLMSGSVNCPIKANNIDDGKLPIIFMCTPHRFLLYTFIGQLLRRNNYSSNIVGACD